MINEHSNDEDPFSKLELNDDFVCGAERRELSAQDRIGSAARLRASRTEDAQRRRYERKQRSQWRRIVRALRRSKYVPNAVIVMTLLAMAWLHTTSAQTEQPLWRSADAVETVQTGDRPTPQRATSKVPLGTPAETGPGGGPHQFIDTQPGSAEPVAYDPCRPIKTVVNNRTAPVGADRLVSEAIAEISRASGLNFEHEGATDEAPIAVRRPFQPERYGDRWAPVLIAWSDPEERPELDGDIAGMAGSASLELEGKPEVYVSGNVLLDGPQMAKILRDDNGWEAARSVVVHELAHLVGLEHVDDASQIMNPVGSPDVVELQNGDRAGLARLGRGACVAEL